MAEKKSAIVHLETSAQTVPWTNSHLRAAQVSLDTHPRLNRNNDTVAGLSEQ